MTTTLPRVPRFLPCVPALLTIALLLTGCGHKIAPKEADAAAKDAPLPTVHLSAAQVGTIEQTLPLTGTLSVRRAAQATVSPATAGVLDALPVHTGQSVTQGQTVAHLSTQTLQGQMQQAQATIAQNQVQVQQAQANALQAAAQARTGVLQAQSAVSGAEATLSGAQATLLGNEAALQNARQSLERQQTLLRDGLVAQKDVEAAQLAVRTAQAQVNAQREGVQAQRRVVDSQRTAVDAARAAGLQTLVKQKDVQVARQQVQAARGALRTAEAQMALLTLRAPLAGQVTDVGASLGETVDTTTKVVTIANLDTLQLQVAVPAAARRLVHIGLPLTFQVDALPGRTFRTQIRRLGAQVDTASNTVPALALVVNTGHALAGGEFARVRLVMARHVGAILVPKAAVLRAPDGTASVVTVDPNHVAHIVLVQLGISDNARMEIVSGLAPGAHVATVGGYGLPDGAKVATAPGAGASP